MSQGDSGRTAQLQEEWVKVREQFAMPSQSVQEGREGELTFVWVNRVDSAQFQGYDRDVKAIEGRQGGLKGVIQDVLKEQKNGQLLIAQKFTFERAMSLAYKVRNKCKKIIEDHKQSQTKKEQKVEEVKVEETRQQEVQKEVRNEGRQLSRQQSGVESVGTGQIRGATNQFQQFSKMAPAPIQLPTIRNKGKVYNPQQMANYFQLSDQSHQDYTLRSPHMFETKQKMQVSSKAKIFSNKYLKMTFERFCRQAYKTNGYFGQILMQGDKMNMNKWMVFCKQFDFNVKFHSKHLIQIYQEATKFSSTMDLNQFLTAVGLLQQKYMERYHKGDNFVEDIMKINSEAAYKVKMANLKVHYGGPKRNFFQYAGYSERQRLDQIEKDKEFKKKKKEREIVLISGMYQEHLKAEIQKRKQDRERLKQSRGKMVMNRSVADGTKIDRNTNSLPQSPRTVKPDGMGYSKIFHIKQNTARKTTTNTSLTQSPAMMTQMYNTEARTERKEPITESPEEWKTNLLKPREDQGSKQWGSGNMNHNKSDVSVWLTKVRNDSEESDDILRQHMELEKKIQAKRSSVQKSSWMKEMEDQSKKVSEYQQQMEDQSDEEDMAETGANFNLQARA